MEYSKNEIEIVNLKSAWKEKDLQIYFGISNKWLKKLVSNPTFPQKNKEINKWSAELVKKWWNKEQKEINKKSKKDVVKKYL